MSVPFVGKWKSKGIQLFGFCMISCLMRVRWVSGTPYVFRKQIRKGVGCIHLVWIEILNYNAIWRLASRLKKSLTSIANATGVALEVTNIFRWLNNLATASIHRWPEFNTFIVYVFQFQIGQWVESSNLSYEGEGEGDDGDRLLERIWKSGIILRPDRSVRVGGEIGSGVYLPSAMNMDDTTPTLYRMIMQRGWMWRPSTWPLIIEKLTLFVLGMPSIVDLVHFVVEMVVFAVHNYQISCPHGIITSIL